MQTTYPRIRRWTRVEYDRLIDQGIFQPGEPLELLAGQLVVREPQGDPHSLAVELVHEALRAAFGLEWRVRALVVEVADSSLALDRTHKGSFYARARLSEYWIVNLADRVLEVYRDPGPDAGAPYGWAYRVVLTLGRDEHVVPLAAPSARILVADLLP